MSKARPRAPQRKRDIHLELLPGQKVKVVKQKPGTRDMSTVRAVLRGVAIVRRVIKKAQKKSK